MPTINKKFSLPNEQQEFNNLMKKIENCEILDSKISENSQGPEIEETYRCPCGNIKLKQNSIITNIENPEKGNIEIINMESKGCDL